MSLEHELLERFVTTHPADAARTLSALPKAERAAVVAVLVPQAAAELLRHLPSSRAASTLAELPLEAVSAILSAARRDVAAAVLRTTEGPRRASLVATLPPKVRATLSGLLRYAEDTAGSLMDPNVLAVHEEESVGRALELLARESEQALYYLYVVGGDQRLVGVVNIRELMCAQPDAGISSVCTRTVDSVSASSTRETVLHHPAWQRVHALPVVESGQRFVGAIRYETIRRLERGRTAGPGSDQGAAAVSALGELFGLGLRGLLQWGASGETPHEPTDSRQPRSSLDER